MDKRQWYCQIGRKRRARAETANQRTKASPATRCDNARLQSPGNTEGITPLRNHYNKEYQLLNWWRWGQSSANASLNENSLLSGKIQGISADSAPETIQGSVFRTINQWVAAKFPTQWNREFFRENSEFPRRIRECRMSMIVGQCLLLAHSRLFELARRKSVVGGKADIAAMARWPP